MFGGKAEMVFRVRKLYIHEYVINNIDEKWKPQQQ